MSGQGDNFKNLEKHFGRRQIVRRGLLLHRRRHCATSGSSYKIQQESTLQNHHVQIASLIQSGKTKTYRYRLNNFPTAATHLQHDIGRPKKSGAIADFGSLVVFSFHSN